MAPVSEAEASALFGATGSILARLVQAWAEPRPGPVSTFGAAELAAGLPSSELRAWLDLFARFDLEAADPAEAELRAPGDLPDLAQLLAGGTGPSAIADLFGILTASVVFAQQDELAYLASVAGTARGVSPVFSFHPDDWGLFWSDPSISTRLFRLDLAARRSDRPFGRGFSGPESTAEPREMEALRVFEAAAKADPLPRHHDPARLAARVDWLVRAWVGLPFAEALTRAPSPEDFERERALLGTHPHLALYWSFAHALSGDRLGFEACARAARERPHPFLVAAHAALGRWIEGRPARLGPLDEADFEAIREARIACAPPPPGGQRPGAGPRVDLDDDPSCAPFLELFDHLKGGREPDPWRGMRGVELEDKLADLAQPACLPLLEAALREGAAAEDHQPAAGRGHILARAALARDLEELDRALADAGGTERFGPRRRDEVWRAVARFDEPEATARLARGAAAFARESEDWLRTASKVPWDHLLALDVVPTHDLVARFAEGVPYTATTVPLLVEVAQAARRHRVARAVPGLRRAIAGGIGRLDDGGRSEIAWAVAELDPEAGPFLAAVADILRAEWTEADEADEVERLGWSLAAVVGPWLAVAPDHPSARALAAELLGRVALDLGPGRAPRAESFEAGRALVLGARLGEVALLEPTVVAIGRLRPRVRPSAKAAHARFRAALEPAFTP